MLKFYYDPKYKYTNRCIIDLTSDTNFAEKDYENIDSPDTINGHIIYTLEAAEKIPTYITDSESGWRWFVSGITQLRTGKFQISLLRDIISESPETWKEERAYITAGTATNYNKYKRWDLPYTNTKIREERLNINGGSSFFVFYTNTQNVSSGGAIAESDLELSYASIPGVTGFDYQVNGISSMLGSQYFNAGEVFDLRDLVKVKFLSHDNTYFESYYQELVLGTYLDISTPTPPNPMNNCVGLNKNYSYISSNTDNCKTNLETAIANFISAYNTNLGLTYINSVVINSLNSHVGQVILDTSNNKVYKLSCKKVVYPDLHDMSPNNRDTLLSAIRNIFDNYAVSFGNEWVNVLSEKTGYTYTLEEIGTATTFDFNFKADVRKLPKSAVRCVNIVPDDTHNKEEITQCLMLAQANILNLNDTGRILDIQYLPFSIATSVNANLKINNTDLTAQFLDMDDYQYAINLSDLSNINKETDTIKIVSPSRASQYLFRPYDNNGNMEFTAKITIKPYTSVIYVRPSTQGLLINDWDDKDCLIIQEDFSLTNISSEWTQYVYQNRTYLNAFERQLQGREYERSWERRVEQAQAKSDEWSARNISSQKAQTYTGNLPIISSIAGAIGSAFTDNNYMEAARVDRQYNEALYQEGMSLSRDLFEYQLENIKSQPLIPSKVTTIDAKFLDGVYLEFYSTNETELNAIAKFYEYNGNRIDDYGTFADYWGNFVRGKIIISLNYTQPEIDELNRRLSMGVFTGGIL